jgi:hypothetical protein
MGFEAMSKGAYVPGMAEAMMEGMKSYPYLWPSSVLAVFFIGGILYYMMCRQQKN